MIGYMMGYMIAIAFFAATVRFWGAFFGSCFDRGLWRTIALTPRVLVMAWKDRHR